MKKTLLTLLIVSIAPAIYGKIQTPNQWQGKITGEIVDANSKEKLGYANVLIYQAGDSVLVTGAAAQIDGRFIIENLPKGVYDISFSMIGYKRKKIENIRLNSDHAQIGLGRIGLSQAALYLNGMDVVAERSKLELTLDRKVFTVGKDLANTGSSAADVLDDIPSITVDMEGNVSLRGSSNVRVLVDGKPSGLVGISSTSGLRQLSADVIERVEVITNPSARYDAEGMAGIINLILKKERREGVNGSLDLMSGDPANYGAALNMNFRQSRLNFFANYGLRYHKEPGKGAYYQRFFQSDGATSLDENRDLIRRGLSHNIRLGADYFFSETSILTGSFLISRGTEDNDATTEYRDYGMNDQLIATTFREDHEAEKEKPIEYALTYKKQFGRKDHTLTADFQYEGSSDHETSEIYERQNSLTETPFLTEDVSNLAEEKRTLFQMDYIYPFNREGKFEAGLKINLRDVSNDYYVRQLLTNHSWRELAGLSNNMQYSENIHAAYAIVGNKVKHFSFQIGVRGEYSDIGTHLLETGEKNDRNYLNLFPSAHVTWEFSKPISVQLSYSRRLRRPGHWELNPFSGYSDSRNLRRGNPNLDPEFTHSYELNQINNWEYASLSSGVYYRHTDGVIQYLRSYEDSVVVSQPFNFSSRDAYGFEFTASLEIFKKVSVDGNLNLFNSITEGVNLETRYKKETFSWFGRMNTKAKLGKDFELQLRFHYHAAQESVQGKEMANNFLDVGLSKDILSGNGTLTLSARDLFNTHKHRNETFAPDFYSSSEMQFHSRVITFGFNYRLNQRKSEEEHRQEYESNGLENPQ